MSTATDPAAGKAALSTKSLSFCVGPHFSLVPQGSEGWAVKCGGVSHGLVRRSGETFQAWVGGDCIGTGYASTRQAGIAVLRTTGVKGELEAGR